MMRHFLKVFFFVVTVFFAFNFLSSTANAHPQPLVAQEFFFNYSAEGIEITHRLRLDSLVIDKVYPLLDINNDGNVSREEMEVYANEKVLKTSTIRLNNKDIKFETTPQIKTLKKTEVKSLDDFFEIHFVAINPDLKETNYFSFKQNQKYFPEDQYGDQYRFDDNIYGNPGLENLDNNQLTPVNYEEYNVSYRIVDYTAPETQNENQQQNLLTSMLNDLKNSSSYYANQAKNIDFSNPFLIISGLAVLLIAGALHAITPGHGKSMLAAFLIGKKKSKLKDVLILAASITLAHTAVIYILGFTLLALGRTEQAQSITLIIEKLSSWLMILLALILIYRAYKAKRHSDQHKSGEHHHHHHHSHGDEKVTIRNSWDLFYAGISGGLTPCLDALSLLLLFVSLQQTAIGLVAVFIFSLGLALAIVLLGLALLYGKDKLNIEERFGESAEIYFPFFSGLLILIISVIYLLTK